jgi:V-type H+-transporting ATPase subunit d
MGLLTTNNYSSLVQCDNLEDMKNQLAATTDYYEVLHEDNNNSHSHSHSHGHGHGKMTPSRLAETLQRHFVQQFRYLQSIASPELCRFLEYVTYGYMIDNVVLLLAGALRGISAQDTSGKLSNESEELLARCHPLGCFDTMPALLVSTSVDDIYNTVLVESPLAPYFRGCLSADDLDDLHIELIRNHLWKAYLEDFWSFCQGSSLVNAATRALMERILGFEADRRTINIAVNACGSDRLGKDERFRLFPRFGAIWDSGIALRMAHADDVEQIRALLETLPEYRTLLADYVPQDRDLSLGFKGSASTTSYEIPVAGKGLTVSSFQSHSRRHEPEPRSLEEHFFANEVALCKAAFEQQFTFACFYAWIRLKEQEIRNIVWISECIAQQQRQNIHNYIPLY